MITWLKAIHIVALMVWCAGLLVMPSLFVQRNTVGGREQLTDLQRFARTVFIHVTSPAAFLAVVAGTLLVFSRSVFTVWMMLKLFAVGALVVIHVRVGYLLINLFDPGGQFAQWRKWALTAATLAVIGVILVLVLGKPDLSLASLPQQLRQPGGLQSLLEIISPTP